MAIKIPVSDYHRSKQFYAEALRPLGYVILLDWHDARRAYLGLEGEPSSLWLIESETAGGVEVSLEAASPARIVDPDGNVLELVAPRPRRAAA